MNSESCTTEKALSDLYDFFSQIHFESCRNCVDCCFQPWFLIEEKANMEAVFRNDIIEVDSVSMCNSPKCRFSSDGCCAIYKNRPLDCRLFPLDIIEYEGSYWWAVFKTCTKYSELKQYLIPGIDYIESLITKGMFAQYERQIEVTKRTYAPYRDGHYEIIREFRRP
ncbi:MAG: YkgJ family cysteine cluster protein [Candidatus Riflebacteria bacterium]|nr:YkgJ family cysteine cluster protein [Candidatus Riflebacteria bacterium]